MQSVRSAFRAQARLAGSGRRRPKTAGGWIALALLITGEADASVTSPSSRALSGAQLDMSTQRVAVKDAVERIAPALSDGAATRLRITLNGLRQAMDNGNANAPALARAAQIELDAYVRSVGASKPDVDAIRLALAAVASHN
jgi:hypothetical protein